MLGVKESDLAPNAQCILLLATLLHPRSRGTVTLAGSDPLLPPVIDPQYLTDQRDVRWLHLTLLAGGVRSVLYSVFCAVESSPTVVTVTVL